MLFLISNQGLFNAFHYHFTKCLLLRDIQCVADKIKSEKYQIRIKLSMFVFLINYSSLTKENKTNEKICFELTKDQAPLQDQSFVCHYQNYKK